MNTSPWTFEGDSTPIGGADAVTLVEGASFAISARSGDVVPGGAHGVFVLDTRIVSGWRLTIEGHAVEPLQAVPNGPFAATFVGRAHAHPLREPHVVDAPLLVLRRRAVGRGLREDIEVRNHGVAPVDVRVELAVESDFASLFDVKSGHDGARPGRAAAAEDRLMFEPTARAAERTPVDAVGVRATPCDSTHAATRSAVLAWQVTLGVGQRWSTCVQAVAVVDDRELEPSHPCGATIEDAVPARRLRSWQRAADHFRTDDHVLDLAFRRSIDDLGALRIFDPDHPERLVVAAGAPWFMTLFGRDAIIASWMALLIDQTLALGVLAELADTQGTTTDERSEEQPGRILHEVRFDRLSAELFGGDGKYFGSIDSTPLFVMLVAELARWIGPTEQIAALLPAVDRAIAWIEGDGDLDGDGFVEYLRAHPGGLEHQGWKDSWDGIRHDDGAVAQPPIALCEVQGYCYAAYRGRADLARAFGDGDTATASDRAARSLRTAFDRAFWIDDLGWYAVGLDADKRPIRSLTSNVGHLLWTGIAPSRRVRRLAQVLDGPAMSSGWGLRTLAETSPGYNPLSYHCGSVWPHDTAIAVAGLARVGSDRAAGRLTRSLIDASATSGGRLPELFSGLGRGEIGEPVPYPASCSPQAWAAAATLLLVRSVLGLQPDLLAGRVSLRPRLPAGVSRLHLDVPLGGRRLRVRIDHGEVVADVDDDAIEVEIS